MKAREAKDLRLDQYIKWLKNDEYFSILKWGDSEWRAIFNSEGYEANQARSLELQKDMRQALIESAKFKNSKSRILFEIPRHVREDNKKRIAKIEKYLQQVGLTKIFWTGCNTVYSASRDGKLFPLVQELRQKTLVVIGPAFLKLLSEQTFNYADFVGVPVNNCYAEKDEILQRILQIHERLGDGIVYSFSTGPAAEVFIAKLVPKMPENFLIDFGSLWDVFCGQRSRRYTKSSSYTNEILKKNLGLKC